MVSLVDVNVLVALAWPNHVHHGATRSWFERQQLVGYRQVTDAQLLALALRHDGRLATLDSAIRRLVPSGYRREERVILVAEG